jgi:hypothetical protein
MNNLTDEEKENFENRQENMSIVHRMSQQAWFSLPFL